MPGVEVHLEKERNQDCFTSLDSEDVYRTVFGASDFHIS